MFTDNFRDISQDRVAIDYSRRRILRVHFLRITPCGSIRKKSSQRSYFLVEDSVVADYLPFKKSLSSGNGSFRDSANVC